MPLDDMKRLWAYSPTVPRLVYVLFHRWKRTYTSLGTVGECAHRRFMSSRGIACSSHTEEITPRLLPGQLSQTSETKTNQCHEATANSAPTRRETPLRGPRFRALMI